MASSDDELLGSLDELEAAGVTSQPVARASTGALIDREAGISEGSADEQIAPERPGEFDSFIDNEAAHDDTRHKKRGEKRRRAEGEGDYSDEGGDDELDEEDRLLIGATAKGGNKHRRLKKKTKTTEGDAAQEGEKKAVDRIAEALFGDDEMSVDIEDEAAKETRREDFSEDFDDEEELNEFIVDENDKPVRRPQKRKKGAPSDVSNEQLESVRQIFGTDRLDDLEFMDEDLVDDQLGDMDAQEQAALYYDKIKEVYEPAQLEAAFMSKHDEKIRNTDIPERLQLRYAKRPEINQDDVEREIDFICKQAFEQLLIQGGEVSVRAAVGTVLQYLHEYHVEIPYILLFAQEAWCELNIPDNLRLQKKDLWTIYSLDYTWSQLSIKKEALIKSMEGVLESGLPQEDDEDEESEDSDLDDDPIAEMGKTDEERAADKRKKEEEQKRKEEEKRKREQARLNRNASKMTEIELLKSSVVNCTDLFRLEDITAEFNLIYGDEALKRKKYKQARSRDIYKLATENQIPEFAFSFAPNVKEVANALLIGGSSYKPPTPPISPFEAAAPYISNAFSTSEEVIDAAVKYLAKLYASNTSIRESIDNFLSYDATVSTYPTSAGRRTIDAFHEYGPVKALRNKPADSFVDEYFADYFARIVKAEAEGLIKHSIDFDPRAEPRMMERFEFFVSRGDDPAWVSIRARVLKSLLDDHLKPLIANRVRERLKKKSVEFVLNRASTALEQALIEGPYNREVGEDGEVFYPKIMGISYSNPGLDKRLTQAVMLDENGNPIASLGLTLAGQKRSPDIESLRDFIEMHKPDVVCIGADSVEVVNSLYPDVTTLILDEIIKRKGKKFHTTFVNAEVAVIYSNSKYGKREFPEYDVGQLRAVSIARRLYDPLSEMCRLVNMDHDLRNLRLDPLQSVVPGNLLDERLEAVFVDVVNHVGVDINRCYRIPWLQAQLNFVSGLGPRKARALLDAMEKNGGVVSRRQELLDGHLLGPIVYKNAAGILKFNRVDIQNQQAEYNLLDTMRIHPDDYEYAVKMAKDAVDDDDRRKKKRRQAEDDEIDEQEALQELLADPKKLEEIDIGQFDQMLRDEFRINKYHTLTSIKNELNNPYYDFRKYRDYPIERVFDCATNTTTNSFRPFMLVHVRVNPSRKEGSINLRVQEVDIPAFIERGGMPESVEEVDLIPGATFVAVLVSIDPLKFSCRVSLNERDVDAAADRYMDEYYPHDPYLDKAEVRRVAEAEDDDEMLDEEQLLKKKEEEKPRFARYVVHGSFRNKTGTQLRNELAGMEVGQYLFRPSSRDENHLTVAVKFYGDLIYEIEVEELDKANKYSLGKKLKLGNETYDDLNELGLRGIEKMASNAAELAQSDKFVMGSRDEVDRAVKDLKRSNPNAIVYRVGIDHKNPGFFILFHMVYKELHRESIAVVPEGFRFRGKVIDTVKHLFDWFKKHAKDPVPTARPVYSLYPTQSNTAAVDMDVDEAYDPGQALGPTPSYPTAPIAPWPIAMAAAYPMVQLPGQAIFQQVAYPVTYATGGTDSWGAPRDRAYDDRDSRAGGYDGRDRYDDRSRYDDHGRYDDRRDDRGARYNDDRRGYHDDRSRRDERRY